MDGWLDGFAVSHYYIYQAGPFKKKQSVPAAAFPYSCSKQGKRHNIQGEETQHLHLLVKNGNTASANVVPLPPVFHCW